MSKVVLQQIRDAGRTAVGATPRALGTMTTIASSTTTTVLAGVAGKSIHVFQIILSGTNTNAAAAIVTFRDGSTARFTRRMSATSGMISDNLIFASPWKLATAADLTVVTTTLTGAVDIQIIAEIF